MENLSRNGNIAYQAMQRSRPGRGSWLALLLLTGSLLIAFEFGGWIVEQMTYRELFQDAAPLATLANAILGLSIFLAVAGFILAWRLWWTFSLIGATALGIPDIATPAAGWLRAGWAWFASKGVILIGSWLSALGRTVVVLSRLLGEIILEGVSLLLNGMSRVAGRLWTGIAAFFGFLLEGLASVGRPLVVAAVAFLQYLMEVLVLAGPYLWAGVKACSLPMGRVLKFAGRRLWSGIKSFSLAMMRVLKFVGRNIWLSARGTSRAIGRVLQFGGRRLWLAMSTPLMYLDGGINRAGEILRSGIARLLIALGQGMVL